MPNEYELLALFGSVGAVATGGHYVYAGGDHGAVYIKKRLIFAHPDRIDFLCRMIAEEFCGCDVDAVIGPMTGGAVLSRGVARHLVFLQDRSVHAVYAEKSPDGKYFSIPREDRGFISGMRVLVVDDILTTGGSVRKTVDAVRAAGGDVVGVGALWNRGAVTPRDVGGVPIVFSLINVSIPQWNEASCPLCRENKLINTDLGHGADFLSRRSTLAR